MDTFRSDSEPKLNDDFERLVFDYMHDNEPLFEENDSFFANYSAGTLAKMRNVLASNVHSEINDLTIKSFDIQSGVDPNTRLAKRYARRRLHWWVLESYNLYIRQNVRGDIESRTNLFELKDILDDMRLAGYSSHQAHELYLSFLSKVGVQPDYTIGQFKEWGLEDAYRETTDW